MKFFRRLSPGGEIWRLGVKKEFKFQVVGAFKKYSQHYVSPPTILVKKYAAISQKASDLIAALKEADVCSKRDILSK